MHIQDFADRVFIIDNREDEIKDLKRLLEEQDIDVSVFNPETDGEPHALKKNRQLIFVDLMLDEDASKKKSNLSRLIMLLSKIIPVGFGPYGLVVWTKHTDSEDELKKIISKSVNVEQSQLPTEEDEMGGEMPHLRVPPVFIVTMNKNEYIEKNSYDTVLSDIEGVVKKSNAGFFFMSWTTSVNAARNKSIVDVYSICKDYEHYDENISYLLYQLAINHTGVNTGNLTVDSYKAFDELLYADLFVQQKEEKNPHFEEKPTGTLTEDDKKNACGKLNSKMFIDNDAIVQNVIVPGNIYKLNGGNATRLKIINKAKINKEEIPPYTSHDVAIELTPPCDFSNKKINSRIVVGYIIECVDTLTAKDIKKLDGNLKGDYLYVLKNIMIEGKNCYMVFDFRHLYTPNDEDLKNPAIFEVWFRAKPKLFADILQKFSSHASRLGLSDIKLS